MSIATYAELQTAISGFLNRDDLAGTAPTFVGLAEADMSRRLRHWRMEARATGDITARYTDVPADWIETIRFNLTTAPISRLEPMSLADMLSRREGSDDATGRPQYFATTNGDFEVFPTPDGTYGYELIYYTRIAALADDNVSNWVLQYHPDAYLYGALVHSAPYLSDDSRVQVWGSFYNAAINAIQRESDAARAGGTGLRIKTRAFS